MVNKLMLLLRLEFGQGSSSPSRYHLLEGDHEDLICTPSRAVTVRKLGAIIHHGPDFNDG